MWSNRQEYWRQRGSSRISQHLIKKCFILKGKILHLYEDRKIKFNEEVVSSYLTDEDIILMTCNHIGDYGDFKGEDNFDTKGLQVDNHSGVPKFNFTNVDLLLGPTPHNTPLFVIRYICEKKVNRILADDGSTVNIPHLKIMKD
ncbi:hypothetical protein J1N35_040361 [Gossypium stocksii]|uniref:Uncharacterized protein n=1 Tax=Gossypium stocksii TaxID=47602 RepID=A0A9D3UE22_9ROSI|nr:hypothetical protein J1N35_040361 [Gossypium stocksii]